MDMFYIYQIKNILNEKLYIGRTNNPQKRWAHHRNYPFTQNGKQDECPKLYSAIRKYSIDKFEFKILGEYNSEELCRQAEIDFIKLLGTIEGGYNITEGGDGVSGGSNHPFYGKTHTQKSRDKISRSKKGKKMGPASESRKQKISKALKGKPHLTTKGENNPASKLKEVDVISIRERFLKGEPYTVIAKSYNVSKTLIRLIVQRKSWTHIP